MTPPPLDEAVRATLVAEETRMLRPTRPIRQRLALAVALALCAGTLAGCNQAPALSKVELDAAKMPAKHPKVAPDVASNCRACHREQPAIRK